MRLGAYTCAIKRKTHLYNAYKETKVTERHRHRCQFNNKYLKRLEKDGLIFLVLILI